MKSSPARTPPAIQGFQFLSGATCLFDVLSRESGQTSHQGKQKLNDWACPEHS
jgi:hypothetical protein